MAKSLVTKRIPIQSRRDVEAREKLRCGRCGGRGTEWHHRRSRRVRDEWTHNPCNGVLLCHQCHPWVHAHPTEAEATGFIVSQWQPEPWTVPIQMWHGWVHLSTDGGFLAV